MRMKSSRSLALLSFVVAAACARHSGEIAGLNLGGIPLFETRLEIATDSATHADYRIADFDGNGVLDMAVISLTGELRVLLGNGTGFNEVQATQVGGIPAWISGGDFDNDGDQDLVIVRSDADLSQVWLNNGSGTFEQGQAIEVGRDALSAVVGDFDDDGQLDIAISRPVAPEIFVTFGNGDGTFTSDTQLSLPGGGSALTLTAGDVTRDGVDDLLVSDPATNRVLVYDGLPSDGFGSSFVELAVGGTPGACSIGDLSGDGLPDIVVSAFSANKYVVITEIFGPIAKGVQQQGPFVNEAEYASFDIPVAGRPSLSTIADVTGDGLVDLVGCLAFQNSMVVAPQQALPQGQVNTLQGQLEGGPYSKQFQLDTTGLPLRPFVGDADGNGKNDLFALSGLGGRINLWLANDSGRLAGARNHKTNLVGASWVEAADFDGDGQPEIVTGSFNTSTLSFLGRADGDELAVETLFDVGLGVLQLKSADLDLDGKVDLIVGVDGGLRVLRNRSVGGVYDFELLGTPVAIGSGTFPFGMSVTDLDRDGDFDIAVCDFVGGGVHLIPGTPTPFVFGTETVIDLGGGPIDVVAADFTGDGQLDLAVSRGNQSDIVVLRNDGAFAFSQFLNVPVGDAPNYLVTADFNRDARADLVVSNAASGTITVLFGNASGFSGQSYPAGALPTALMARDLSGDGIPDILVTSMQSGDFRVMVGDGTGSFPLLPTFPGTAGASDALLQDMTGDGRPELVISSIISNRVSLVLNITQN